MKTILFIDADGGWGGAPKSLLTLVKHLDSHAFRPMLLIGMFGPVVDEYRKRGISPFVGSLSSFVYSLNNRGFILKKTILMALLVPRTIVWLRRITKREGIDVVHINSLVLLPTAFLCKLFLKLPIIFHGREMLLENALGSLQRRLIRRIGDRIITPSENEAKQWGGEGDRVLIRYNPVDLQEFQFSRHDRERIRTELHVDEETIIISTIGAIIPGKGQDRIIGIAREIGGRYGGGVKFLIVGRIDIPREKGRLRRLLLGEHPVRKFQRELAEKILEKGLQEYVSIMEHRRDIWAVLSASDIVLRTSRLNDPWGRDIIEAMVMGRPIVATGTYEGFLEEGKNGFLVPPQRTEEETVRKIGEKLLTLIHDRKLRESMGERNMTKGRMLFDPDKYARSMEEIYRSVLHRGFEADELTA